jgi:hypothetical protein
MLNYNEPSVHNSRLTCGNRFTLHVGIICPSCHQPSVVKIQRIVIFHAVAEFIGITGCIIVDNYALVNDTRANADRCAEFRQPVASQVNVFSQTMFPLNILLSRSCNAFFCSMTAFDGILIVSDNTCFSA